MPTLLGRLLPPLGLALAVAACGNDDGGPLTPPPGGGGGGDDCPDPTFSSLHARVLSAPRCIACHGESGDLDLSGPKATVHAALVGVPSVNTEASATARVVAGDPDASWLYVKVAEADPPGGRMPLGGAALKACELEALRAWIEAGALDD